MTPQVQSQACPSPGPHWGQPGYPHHRLGRRGKDWRNATWEKGPTSLHTLPRAAHALPGTLLSTLGPFRLKSHLPCEAERLRERHVVMSPPVGNRANEREVMPPGSWGGRGRTDPAWAGSQALLLLLTPLQAAPKTFPNFTRRPSCPHTRAFLPWGLCLHRKAGQPGKPALLSTQVVLVDLYGATYSSLPTAPSSAPRAHPSTRPCSCPIPVRLSGHHVYAPALRKFPQTSWTNSSSELIPRHHPTPSLGA